MSLEIGKYHGNIYTRFQEEIGNESVFSIKDSEDLSQVAHNIFISQKATDEISARIDLKEKNIFLIYIVMPGGGQNYCLKKIDPLGTDINVKIVGLSCPYIMGTCDLNAKIFVLSAPKDYEKENIKVSVEDLDIYSEPEFEGFENIYAMDKQLMQDFYGLNEGIRDNLEFSVIDHITDEVLYAESWYILLTDCLKEVVRHYRNAVFSTQRRTQELGEEKQMEMIRDQSVRYSRLEQRLEGEYLG
jgi:hypothetical protein